jgi:WD40 repeat protein
MLPILLACSLAAPPDFEALPADAISRIGSPKLTRPVRSAESAHLTADGRYAIFVASNPGRGRTQTRPPETPAEWWDLQAGKRIVPPFDLPNDCRIVRAVPAGIVTDQRGSYQLRNPATGAVQFEISPPRERGRSYFNVPNFSPDGKTAVAFVNEVITVYRLQPDGKVIGTPTPVKSPGPWAASHRGGVIVWLDDEEIKRLDLGSGEIRVVQKLEEPLNILLSLTVSPDGNAIVAVLRDRNGDHQPEIRMYPGRLPAVTFKPSSRKSYLSRVEFTTDGRELFSIYGDHTIIWSAETREILHEFTTPSYGNTLLTPDASRLLFIDQRGTIRVFDPRTQNELTPPVTRLPDLEFVSWRDENTLIASGLSNATAGDESKMRGAVIHWKADSSTVLSNIPITAKETARVTHFHPAGTLAVAQVVGSTAPILIDPSTGKLVRDFPNRSARTDGGC